MNGEIILKAMTDIEDDFINNAADDEYVKNVFRQLRKKQPVRVNMRKMIIAAIIIVLIIISVLTASSFIFKRFAQYSSILPISDGTSNPPEEFMVITMSFIKFPFRLRSNN